MALRHLLLASSCYLLLIWSLILPSRSLFCQHSTLLNSCTKRFAKAVLYAADDIQSVAAATVKQSCAAEENEGSARNIYKINYF